MGIGPQNLGAMGMSSSSHACGSPLNKIVGGKNKDKKKQKKYNKLAKDLNVNTATDTLIGPSGSHSMSKIRASMFDTKQLMKEIPVDKDGNKSFNGSKHQLNQDLNKADGGNRNGESKRSIGYKGKKGTEWYSLHQKDKYKKK